MKVLKFGGSSLRDAARIGAVVEIVRDELKSAREEVVVVVSALGGVTDELGEAARLAAAGESLESAFRVLVDRHREVAEVVAREEECTELVGRLEAEFRGLRDLLRGIALVGECSPRSLDQILSFGERLSATLVAAAMRRGTIAAEACDARALVVTERRFGGAPVLTEPTQARMRAYFADREPLQVVTGFIAACESGETTTLGRGGSDLTAALLGAALGASRVELWTDVDGVMSADPRLVPGAFSLDRLSYEELMELSHFGAKVVYPPSVLPARRSSIPLAIKNSLNPSFPGTTIEENVPRSPRAVSPVTGVTSISEVALMRLGGDEMAGVPGTTRRLFDALARADVSVLLISQASSEHSICFAVDPRLAAAARRSIETEFAHDRVVGAVDELVVEEQLAVVAVVGEGMRERPGISGRLFRVLGRRGINVRAIAQGSSELNISLVVHRDDERRALNAVHDAFFRTEEVATLRLFVAGLGRVGGEFLDQVAIQAPRLESELGIAIEVAGLCNSKRMLLDRDGLDRTNWRQLLAEGGASAPEELADYALDTVGLRAFVDCTASESVAELYPRLLAGGVAVVTANKKPFAGSHDLFRQIVDARLAFGRGLYHESTVGAGLPVLRTLRSLLLAGDRLLRIEGVFSGTLAFLLGELRRGETLSRALRTAHERGYTEPDPREDLSGMDVARKLLILAREAGLVLELDDVAVAPLIAATELADLPLVEFWQRLPEQDAHFAQLQRQAAEEHEELCYLAQLEVRDTSHAPRPTNGNPSPQPWGEGCFKIEGRASVALRSVNDAHPCAHLQGTDNLFAIFTERYRETPLVIRGPGAGKAVTAGGVFGDLLQAHAEMAGEAGGMPLPGSTKS